MRHAAHRYPHAQWHRVAPLAARPLRRIVLALVAGSLLMASAAFNQVLSLTVRQRTDTPQQRA